MSDEKPSDEQREAALMVQDISAAMFSALRARRFPTLMNKRDVYGRTLFDGEAAFHALMLIGQTGNLPKNTDQGAVEIPRWVFNGLLSARQAFNLVGRSETNRMTLGQVVGCEPKTSGGRETASLSRDTWNELRVYGVAMSIKRACDRSGLKITDEELAGLVVPSRMITFPLADLPFSWQDRF